MPPLRCPPRGSSRRRTRPFSWPTTRSSARAMTPRGAPVPGVHRSDDKTGEHQAAAPERVRGLSVFPVPTTQFDYEPTRRWSPMSLTSVVDAVIEQALPCHLVDPDLFFAE